jgi:arylsulfatase A
MMKKAALVISLFVFSIGSFSQKKNNLKKPNIIYILADDLGYGELHAVVPLVGEC